MSAARPSRVSHALDGPAHAQQRQALARRRQRLRWTAAGLAEAQKGFRRVKGHRDLPELTAALRYELNPTPAEEAAAARAA